MLNVKVKPLFSSALPGILSSDYGTDRFEDDRNKDCRRRVHRNHAVRGRPLPDVQERHDF